MVETDYDKRAIYIFILFYMWNLYFQYGASVYEHRMKFYGRIRGESLINWDVHFLRTMNCDVFTYMIYVNIVSEFIDA